jgi:RNA polymerase sigma factor (sigma-70 family)
MPRTRGAATKRSDAHRSRGEHDNQTKKKAAAERRTANHRVAEPTTDSLQLFINQAMQYPLLTAEEEVELAKRIERGDLAAKERMINSNLRLVIKFARRYQGHGLDLGDLVQEAMLGLIRATEKFDWRRGYKFSTYAVLWIKQSIQRGLDNSGRPVRIPAHIAQRERTVNRVASELTGRLDREPTDEEVAEEAELPLDEVMAVRDLTRVTASLDTPVGEGDTTLGELHTESTEDLEDEVLEREQEMTVAAALAKLPEKERKIISARFGTGGRPARTLRDAAKEAGVTQEQARRLEARALGRLSGDDSLADWRAAA